MMKPPTRLGCAQKSRLPHRNPQTSTPGAPRRQSSWYDISSNALVGASARRRMASFMQSRFCRLHGRSPTVRSTLQWRTAQTQKVKCRMFAIVSTIARRIQNSTPPSLSLLPSILLILIPYQTPRHYFLIPSAIGASATTRNCRSHAEYCEDHPHLNCGWCCEGAAWQMHHVDARAPISNPI